MILPHLGQIFREDFKSPLGVYQNGGVISGAVVGKSKATLSSTSQYIDYISRLKSIGILSEFTFIIRGRWDFDSGTNYGSIVSCTKGGTQIDQFLYISSYTTSERLFVRTTNGTTYKEFISTDNISSDDIIELAFVWSGTWTVYLNGSELAGSIGGTGFSGSVPFVNATEFVIGDGVPAGILTGEVEHSEMFNYAMTADEVQDRYDNSTFTYKNKATAYWPLHDKIGTSSFTTTDVLNGHDLTYGDGSTTSLFPTKLNDRNGCLFDGADSLRIANHSDFQYTGTFTIGIWLDFDNFDATRAILTKSVGNAVLSTNGTVVYEVSYNNGDGNLYFQIGDGTDKDAVTFAVSSIHVRQGLLVVSWDGTTDADGIKMWIDDVLVATATATITAIQQTTDALWIGDSTTTSGWNSNIYGVFIGQGELTPIQIKDIVAKGSKYLGSK